MIGSNGEHWWICVYMGWMEIYIEETEVVSVLRIKTGYPYIRFTYSALRYKRTYSQGNRLWSALCCDVDSYLCVVVRYAKIQYG